MIKVYHASPCPFGRKVLGVLNEKNLDYEIQKMSFKNGDHKKADYLKLNPNGEFPVIDDEGFVLYESSAIAEYLEDEYPEPRLLPADSEPRARVRMLHQFSDLHLAPAFGGVFKKLMMTKEEPTAEDNAELSSMLGRLADYLGKGPFLAGKEFSLADCAVLPILASIEHSGRSFEGFERLADYLARAKKRPAFKGAGYELGTIW